MTQNSTSLVGPSAEFKQDAVNYYYSSGKSVNSVLKILGVSSSVYYDYLKRQDSNQKIRKQQVKQEITEIYNESKQIYGAPKIASILQNRGHVISEKTAGNYMRELGIKAIWVSPYKRTTM